MISLLPFVTHLCIMTEDVFYIVHLYCRCLTPDEDWDTDSGQRVHCLHSPCSRLFNSKTKTKQIPGAFCRVIFYSTGLRNKKTGKSLPK